MTSERTLKAIQKAIEALNDISGGQLDVEMPLESITDKILAAQAVISYYDTRGRDFHHSTCGECGLVFAYAYPVHTVKYCSVPCIAKALERRGLRWNPERSLADRYGIYAPAVVPPQALKLLPEFKEPDVETSEPISELDGLLNLLDE